MAKRNRKISVHVTPMTAYNLDRLAQIEKCSTGRVIDKLVRDRMVAMSIGGAGNTPERNVR